MKKLVLALILSGGVISGVAPMGPQPQQPVQLQLVAPQAQQQTGFFSDAMKAVTGGVAGYFAGAGIAKLGALLWAHPVIAAVGGGVAGLIALKNYMNKKKPENVMDIARLLEKYKNDPTALRVVYNFVNKHIGPQEKPKKKQPVKTDIEKQMERNELLLREINENVSLRRMIRDQIDREVSLILREREQQCLDDEYREDSDYLEPDEVEPTRRTRRVVTRRVRPREARRVHSRR